MPITNWGSRDNVAEVTGYPLLMGLPRFSINNPLLPPPDNFRYGMRIYPIEDSDEVGMGVVLFQGEAPTASSIFGYIAFNGITISMAAAKKGYGPLLYDTLARCLGRTIYPSPQLNLQAQKFWERQKWGSASPISHTEAVRKYGVSPWKDKAYLLSRAEIIMAGNLAWRAYVTGAWPEGVAKKNPLAPPEDSTRVFFARTDRLREAILFRSPYASPEDLVAYASATKSSHENAIWRVSIAAAVSGYGPAIYDLLAISAQEPIHPSYIQSPHAKKFWKKQPGRVIVPLKRDQWEAKYGRPEPAVGALSAFHLAEIKNMAIVAAGKGDMNEGKKEALYLRRYLLR